MKFKLSQLITIFVLVALVASVVPAPAYAAVIASVTPRVKGYFDVVAQDTVTPATPPVNTPATPPVNTPTTPPVNTPVTPPVNTPVTPSVNTPVPPPTNTPLPFVRPQMVVNATTTKGTVQTNSEFKLNINLENAGTSTAYSVQAVLTSADLVPLKNGGVSVLGTLDAGNKAGLAQSFLVSGQIYGQKTIVVDLTLTYYDDKGTSYSDKFALTIAASGGVSSGVAAATSTPTGLKSSQLVITGYSTDTDPLQPGEKFTLKLTIQNVGNAKSQRVTMIVGGGSSGSSGETPQPGGVSGGGGDFANFAPVGASNVQSLGDLSPGDKIEASQNLVVNVSTNPGAYPMRITFSYLNDKNETINDEQVITLLVYSLPNLDVSFYQPPGELFTGQPGALPIQIVNVGRRLAVLGNVKIESDGGLVESGTGLVGSLDVGGFFTIDSLFTPDQPGTNKINVTVDYVDDFNQPRTFTKTLEVEAIEQVIEEIPETPGGGVEEPAAETFWQKVKRFILGILGLDSAPPPDTESVPVEEGVVIEEGSPVQPGKGGP